MRSKRADRPEADRKVVRALGAAAGAVVVLLVVGVAAAPPAAAHDATGSDTPGTNYRPVVTRQPGVAGVTVRAVSGGWRLQLTNRSTQDVVVLDYEGRPYLRVGPRGVFQNRNSSATYLNATTGRWSTLPAGVGDGPVRWDRIGDGPSVAWHDHRAHWMADDPPLVSAAPGLARVVADWNVSMEVGGQRVQAGGVIVWVPGPSPWPWVLFGGVVLATIVALVVRVPFRGLCGAVLLAVPALGVVVLAAWLASPEPIVHKLPLLTLPTMATALLVSAAWLDRNRGLESAVLSVVAGLAVLTSTLLLAGTWITRSQLPVAGPADLSRLAVAMGVGVGGGVGLAALALVLGAARQAWSRPVSPPSSGRGAERPARSAPGTTPPAPPRVRSTSPAPPAGGRRPAGS